MFFIPVADLSPSYNSKTLSAVPWMDRQSKLLYRGSCHPTINASERQGHYLLRGEFCKTLQNQESSGIDFKLRSSDTQACSQHAAETLLIGNCLPCCSNSSLKVNYMAQNFKYQLILDGYGPSYESGIWKFLSCGTVFKGEHPSGKSSSCFGTNLSRKGWTSSASFLAPWFKNSKTVFRTSRGARQLPSVGAPRCIGLSVGTS